MRKKIEGKLTSKCFLHLKGKTMRKIATKNILKKLEDLKNESLEKVLPQKK